MSATETAHLDDVNASPAAASPTQSLDRAMLLLDAVVMHAVRGIGLGPLAEQAELSKPTAHRLLNGLRNAGLIDYDAGTRLFHPAFKLYRMGLAAGARFDVIQLAGPSLRRLSDATGDTVYLTLRNDDFLNCVAREIGDFPIKMLTLSVGDTRPLGLGSNGLVLLAALPDAECERIMARHRDALRDYPHFDPVSLRTYVEETRRNGYGYNEGLMLPEMAAIAMGIRTPAGTTDASISIASITSRMQQPRRDSILHLLRQEVHAIEQLMQSYQQARPLTRQP